MKFTEQVEATGNLRAQVAEHGLPQCKGCSPKGTPSAYLPVPRSSFAVHDFIRCRLSLGGTSEIVQRSPASRLSRGGWELGANARRGASLPTAMKGAQ